MRRRILLATITAALVAVAVFGIPLAIVVEQLYQSNEVVVLDRAAEDAALTIGNEPGPSTDLTQPSGGIRLALYGTSGRLVVGEGPMFADSVVDRAVQDGVVDDVVLGEVVVAIPIASDGKVVAVLRAARDEAVVAQRIRHARWLMAALGIGAAAIAGLVGLAIARRFARPVENLVEAARRLGARDFSIRSPRSGIAELDAAGTALGATAARLRDVLERERELSANASHQLRTPAAALRIELEAAMLDPESTTVPELSSGALRHVERLEQTITTLLDVAWDQNDQTEKTDLGALILDLDREWQSLAARRDRWLSTTVASDLEGFQVGGGPVREIISVLIENAIVHGTGLVRLTARRVGSGVAIDVSDEGRTSLDPATVFRRRQTHANRPGIGLALARSLAEAEGGRLINVSDAPTTTFRLLLAPPAAGSDELEPVADATERGDQARRPGFLELSPE